MLFDGFDELGSRAARGRLARLIDDLATTYAGRDNHFIVSTRIVGYEGQLDNYGFTARTVQELDDKAIRDLVTRRYRAIAIGEGLGRSPQEQQDLTQRYQARAEHLLDNLRRNHGLRTLTTNPLLLSLIVLVHMVQIELPQQRHLLYRDCVEILTERWQLGKRDTVGLTPPRQSDELTLDQKIILLQELALTMQQRREAAGSPAVIARTEAAGLIAARLPSFLAAHLPTDAEARQQACGQRAQVLLDNIREESGILLEKGLDTAGEPVIGFSHLTFQEYLAADALRERPDERPTLFRHLFHPAWREVLLLYVSMVDAGEVVQACLDVGDQLPLTRWLLAGRCLAEKVTVSPQLRQQVTTALADYLCDPQMTEPPTVNALIYNIGREDNYDWLLGNLGEVTSPAEQAALAATTPAARRQALQQLLLRLVQTTNHRGPAGAILSGLGDPRDLDTWVTIPAGSFLMGSAEDDRYATSAEKPQHEVTIAAFAISQYPVTNGQYERFVQATGHALPHHWRQGAPPPWLRNHPVVNVSWHDAQAYCRWLSKVTGRTCRLPTEAEWERAARGTDGRLWPWGNEPPTTELCNFNGNVGTTTAVGAYPAGVSPYGCFDVAGNVWEWTNTLYKGYPYQSNDGREDPNATGLRTLRGGSWLSDEQDVRCAARCGYLPDNRFGLVGFRVVSPGS